MSVVIPCYNHGQYLQEALDSVADQTFDDYEVVIVNDGSTDPATLDLLLALEQPGTRVIHTENCGVSAARNRAIAEADGEYILPLDADDMIASTYLEKAIILMDERPDVSIVYCDQQLFGENDILLLLPDYDACRILVQNLIPVSAVFRRADWERLGGYCERMTFGWEDWEFWIAMSGLERPVAKIAQPLFFYRISALSRDNSLNLFKKLFLYGLIVWRHRALYLKNAGYVLRSLWGHVSSGGHC